MRKMLWSKIHRATVTRAELDYEGSICLAADLIETAKMLPGEAVQIWNVSNGNRFETYIIEGPAGSSEISINGAAARLVSPGDIIIVACFALLSPVEAEAHRPLAVFVDEHNKVTEVRTERPEAS